MHMLKFCLLLCSLFLFLVFLDIFLFLKNFCNIKYAFLLWEVWKKNLFMLSTKVLSDAVIEF